MSNCRYGCSYISTEVAVAAMMEQGTNSPAYTPLQRAQREGGRGRVKKRPFELLGSHTKCGVSGCEKPAIV